MTKVVGDVFGRGIGKRTDFYVFQRRRSNKSIRLKTLYEYKTLEKKLKFVYNARVLQVSILTNRQLNERIIVMDIIKLRCTIRSSIRI